MEKNIPIAQRAQYIPTQTDAFLWWLSTAEKELIEDAVIDRNRYKIIGATVLATWLFATVAWTYFFHTVTGNGWSAWPLGIFMGCIILTIDRALIKGINRQNKQRLWPLFFRGILALTIGTFMAQPALLYMFRKEVALQVMADNEKKQISNSYVLDSLYRNSRLQLEKEKTALQNQLQQQYTEVATARNNYLAEADGSGGTGKVGISSIAKAKKAEYEKLDAAYRQSEATNKPLVDSVDSKLAALAAGMQHDKELYAQHFNDGFLTRIEALNNLVQQNPALQIRYYLLVAILLLIELMPVIAKTLLPSGTYDERVQLREEHERDMARQNIRREQDLKELYNSAALKADTDTIHAFFALTQTDREEKMKSFSQQWRNGNHQSFDGLWEKMKKEILTKQEN